MAKYHIIMVAALFCILLPMDSECAVTTSTLTVKQKELLSTTLDKIVRGKNKDGIAPDYMAADAPAIAEALLLEVRKNPNKKLKEDLLDHVKNIEAHRILTNRDKSRAKSESKLLLEEMVSMFEWDPPLRSTLYLSLFFPAREVDRYANTIRAGVFRAKEQRILHYGDFLLFAYLPSTTPEQAMNLLKGFQPSSRVQEYAVDALLARFGDKTAFDRLIEAAHKLGTEQHRDGVDHLMFGDCLAAVSTKEMKEFLAQGLRSEEVIRRGGGIIWPKRFIYARALAWMMMDDPSFKVTFRWGDFSDKELDEMERWCTTHLGVEYPTTPRKPLYTKAAMIQAPTPKPAQTPVKKQENK